MKDSITDYQKTFLRDIAVEIKVGVKAWEKHPDKKQTVLVDIDLFRFRGAFAGKSIKDCVNYDPVFELVTQTWPERAHTGLLETLVEELITFCLKDKTVDAVRVAVRKPHVFNGKAVPGVEFFRARRDRVKKRT